MAIASLHFKKLDEDQASYLREKNRLVDHAQTVFSDLFSAEENKRIEAGSYNAYISQHGFSEFLQLPKVQERFELSSADIQQINDRLRIIDSQYDRTLRMVLEDLFRTFLKAGGNPFKVRLFDLVGHNAGDRLPDYLLTPLMRYDSDDANGFRRYAFSLMHSAILIPDLAEQIRIDIDYENAIVRQGQIKQCGERGLLSGTQSGEARRAQNAKIAKILDASQVKSLTRRFWATTFRYGSYVDWLKDEDFIDAVEINQSIRKKNWRLRPAKSSSG